MNHMEERLYRLFRAMPVKGVFGNYGEASRYRLLERLGGQSLKESGFSVKAFRDKRTVILYPGIYGDRVYLPTNGRVWEVEDIRDLEKEEESLGILIPAKGIKGNYLVEFPARCQDVYGSVLDKEFMQGVFFEAFPYDKKSFEEMTAHVISQSPSRMPVRIVLVKNEVQYGATDVTGQETAITQAVERMKAYTPQTAWVCLDRDIDGSVLDFHIDMKGQHILKKRRAVGRAREEFQLYFDMEFKEARERFFMGETDPVPGILSSMSFVKAAEYQKVRRTGRNMETAVFQNYMEQADLAREDLNGFFACLWDRFLYEIALLPGDEAERWTGQWMDELRRGFRPKTSTVCPDSPIEYRRLAAEKGIVIGLEKYVNDFVDHWLKQKVYERIENEIRMCEERYR